MSSFGIIAFTPPSFEQRETFEQRSQEGTFQMGDASIAAAASLAGEIGVINLEFTNLTVASSVERIEAVIRSILKHPGTVSGIKCTVEQVEQLGTVIETFSHFTEQNSSPSQRHLAVLTAPAGKVPCKKAVQQLKAGGMLVLAECISVEEAENAVAAGADAVIAKGHEAGGRTGQQTTFVLLQELLSRLKVPVWLRAVSVCILLLHAMRQAQPVSF